MVGELHRYINHGTLGHVAGHAILGCDLAGRSGVVGHGFCVCGIHVTAKAVFVVSSCFPNQRFVGIVASDASETRISLPPAPAILDAIRLETK